MEGKAQRGRSEANRAAPLISTVVAINYHTPAHRIQAEWRAASLLWEYPKCLCRSIVMQWFVVNFRRQESDTRVALEVRVHKHALNTEIRRCPVFTKSCTSSMNFFFFGLHGSGVP